jgi:hypothetical protein
MGKLKAWYKKATSGELGFVCGKSLSSHVLMLTVCVLAPPFQAPGALQSQLLAAYMKLGSLIRLLGSNS